MLAQPRFLPRRAITPLALAVLLALGACGGGGGSDDDEPPAGPATASVSGIASKGLLRNARVIAYRIENGNEIEVGRTTTDAEGKYSLSGLPVGALVLVKISAIAGTTMADEATDTEIDLSTSNFTLRAASVVGSSGTTSVHVTPFSEMAVAKALVSGSGLLTQAKVVDANEDIRSYLHFDPLVQAPEFAAAGTAPKNAPALMLAAVSELVASPSLGCAGSDQIARLQCVINALATGGTFDPAVGAALNEAKQDAVARGDYQGDVIPADVQQQPETLIPVAQRTAIENAKLLIDSVRDNARALEDLGHRLGGVQTSLADALQPLSTGRVAIIQTLVLTTEQLDKYARGGYSGALPAPASELIVPSPRGSSGAGCTLYSDAGFSVEATTYQNADYVACSITYADETTGGRRFLYQHRFTVSPRTVAGGRGYTVTSSLAKQETALNAAWPSDPVNWIGDAQALSDAEDVLVTATGTGTDLTALTLQGDLPPTVSEGGSIGAESLTVDVALSVAAQGDGLSKLSITGLISTVSAVTDEELVTVGLANGSHVIARLAVPGQLNSEVVDYSANRGHFVLQASVAGGSQVTGTLDVSDYGVAAGGDEWPTKVVFAGQIKENPDTALFSGTLTLIASNLGVFNPDQFNGEERADNFLPKQVAFQGTLYLQDVPPLLININLNNATFGTVTGSGSYQQGDRTINIQSSTQQPSGLWTLSLTGPGGVSVALSKLNASSQITGSGGVVVGTVNRSTGRIDYADGTFESF